MEPQIPKPVESFSATLKSIEPKFVLKSKTVLGIILVVGLVLSLIFDIDTQEAMTKAEKLVGLIGGILVVIGLRTKTQPLTFKTKLPSGATNILLAMGMLSMALASGVGLTSCTSLGGSLPAISITPDLCVAAKINKTLADGSESVLKPKYSRKVLSVFDNLNETNQVRLINRLVESRANFHNTIEFCIKFKGRYTQ